MQIKWAFFLASVFTLVSCGNGGSGGSVDEPASTTNLFTDDRFSVFESLGLQVNAGRTPPNVVGTFRMSPRAMQAISVPESADFVGDIALPLLISFSNQNAATRTLSVSIVRGDSDSAISDQFNITRSSISGSGNAFTAYFLSEVTFEGLPHEVALGFSGIVTDAGIENFQQADVVIDNGGDSENATNPNIIDVIPNTIAALFIDLDGFSERLP